MLMELKYLLIKIDNANHLNHQHLFKTEPIKKKINLFFLAIIVVISIKQLKGIVLNSYKCLFIF